MFHMWRLSEWIIWARPTQPPAGIKVTTIHRRFWHRCATEKPRGANFFRIHRGSKSETILRSAVEHLPSDQNFLTGDDPPTWGADAATPTQTPKPDVLMGFNFHLWLTRTTPQRTGNERVKRTNRHFRKLYLSLKKSNSYLRVTIGLKAVPF